MMENIKNQNLNFEEFFELANSYEVGTTDVVQSLAKAIEIYKILVQKKHGKSMIQLANIYLKCGNNDTLHDIPNLLENALFVENEKDSNSFYLLGTFYQTGKGVIKNLQRAFLCFQKSFELGNKLSLYPLGICHLNGIF